MTRRIRAVVGALLLTACGDMDVRNTNAPTEDAMTGNPTRAVLGRAAIGIQIQAFNDLGGEIQQWGIYGRELFNLLGNDPRETGEEVAGPQDPGGRAGGAWGGKYQSIRTINAYLTALAANTDLTAAEKSASSGFAKTLKAWHLAKLAVRSGPTGVPIDVDRPITADPAPFVSFADAMTAAANLMNEANTELLAGGASFPFSFTPGYNNGTLGNFTTPATFSQFNRALAAKIQVWRATFNACTTCWADANTAINASFITTAGLPGTLANGVYYGYTGAAGELANPVTEALTAQRYYAHQSIVTGAQLRLSGQPDLRLTTKTAPGTNSAGAPTPRTLNGITATHKPILYNTATLAANTGADIPWITNEELILLRAEIRWNMATPDRAGAISDINLIRTNAGGLPPTTLTAASTTADFTTELLYNRLYSLMFTQGTRWIDARRYGRTGTLPLDRTGDRIHPNMLVPSAECDARRLAVPCSI